MNEINKSFLNQVKNRFLPLPRNATEELEHEPNISDFNIIKEIGTGAYGKAYLATHKITKAKYAIKAIDKLDIENIKEKSLFFREVEIMYKLDHPNIAKLYSHFEDNNFCYLLMQYIPNGSAYDLFIKKGKKSNLELIASIIRDVIRAIYYLHNMVPKIIHRDIKPENILLDENNNAYLIDFGWSNYILNHRRRSTICGTPLYYPPEMVNDVDYDERVDIWSVGILLFELSTGSIPFQGNDMDTLKQNIYDLNITWPNNIDPDIKDLCAKILKTEPNQRPDIENILEHKFFKKYLRIGDIDKKLIKPTKLKNKIFIVSKDIPEENNSKLKKPLKENGYKRYKGEVKSAKELVIYQNFNTNINKYTIDSKDNIPKGRDKNSIHKINYVNRENLGNKNKLNNSISKLNRENNNSYVYKNNNYHHSTINSSEKKNKRHFNIPINNNNKRINHVTINRNILTNKTNNEENKSNNYQQKYNINSYQNYYPIPISKHWNSVEKHKYNTYVNNNIENYRKNKNDENSRTKNKIIYPKSGKNMNIYIYTDENENEKYQNNRSKPIKTETKKFHGVLNHSYTTINNDTHKGEEIEKIKNKKMSKLEKYEQKQKYNANTNKNGIPLLIKRKKIYL